MIADGLSITLIGMLAVFGFLVFLVAAMIGLNAVLNRFFPKAITAPIDSGESAADKTTENNTPKSEIIAVVVASVKAHIAKIRGKKQ